MRLSVKALIVALLGSGALMSSGSAAESRVVRDPCGSFYCLQSGEPSCPLDVDAWCAQRVGTSCPGVNTCVTGGGCSGEPVWDVTIVCGDAES